VANGIKVVLALGLAGTVLAGCLNAPDGDEAMARAPAQVQVMSKGFTIAGPKGYCIDNGATRETAEGAFAVLGSCAVVSGNPRDAKPRRPAMLTASVTSATAPLDAAALDRAAAFFATEAGHAVLARGDDGAVATVIDLERDDGLVLVHAEDGESAGELSGDYWRGVFEAAGQLVTVTVSGYRDAPLDDRAGAKLARAFVAAIRKANGGAAQRGRATAVAAEADDRLASFFNRLL